MSRASERENKRRHKQRRRALDQRAVARIKESAPCMDCKRSYPAVCMDFDHRDGVEKVASVSEMVADNWPWKDIAGEMAKCDLVCANCHRLRTDARRQHMTSLNKAVSRQMVLVAVNDNMPVGDQPP